MTAWIKPIVIAGDNRLFDFGGSTAGVDNILLAVAGPYVTVCSNSASSAANVANVQPDGLTKSVFLNL